MFAISNNKAKMLNLPQYQKREESKWTEKETLFACGYTMRCDLSHFYPSCVMSEPHPPAW